MAKRRSTGTGSLRKRATGTWQISIMVGRKPNGKRNIKYFTGKTQAEARKKMKAYIDALDAGMDLESNYTLAEWSEVFMTLLKKITAQPDRFVLKQRNNRLAMTVRRVADVAEAVSVLRTL